MDSRSGIAWGRMAVVLGVILAVLAHLGSTAPVKESDSARLVDALVRLDDALDTLSTYFKDIKKSEIQKADDADVDADIEEPKPEKPEVDERSEDGVRPEITAELEDMEEKALAAVPDGQQVAEEDIEEASDDKRQEQVLRAALRYLMKLQGQEKRQKKDYDIPFPVFGYKRGPNSNAE